MIIWKDNIQAKLLFRFHRVQPLKTNKPFSVTALDWPRWKPHTGHELVICVNFYRKPAASTSSSSTNHQGITATLNRCSMESSRLLRVVTCRYPDSRTVLPELYVNPQSGWQITARKKKRKQNSSRGRYIETSRMGASMFLLLQFSENRLGE